MSVSADQDSATVLRSESTTIGVDVTSTSGAPVELSVGGAPTGITATLDRDALEGNSGSTVLTIDVSGAASEQTVDITVTATSGGTLDTATIALTIDSLDVNGAVYGSLQQGLYGYTVRAEGKSTTTGPDGTFSLSGLAVPYDLTVYSAADEIAHVFRGLTTTKPEVTPASALAYTTLPLTATVDVSLPGAVEANHSAQLCAEGLGGVVYGCRSVSAASSTASLNVAWLEGEPTNVRIHSLSVEEDASGYPLNYGSYSTGEVSLSNGETASLTLSPAAMPSTSTVTLDAAVPSGFAFATLYAFARVSDTFVFPLFSTSQEPSSRDVLLPTFSPGTFQFAADASESGGSSGRLAWAAEAPADGSVSLELPTAPALTSPSDGATDVTTDTPFIVDKTDDGALTFVFTNKSSGETVGVTTTEASTTFPDLADIGFGLKIGQGYALQLHQSQPGAGVDEAAKRWPEELIRIRHGLFPGGGPGVENDGKLGITMISFGT